MNPLDPPGGSAGPGDGPAWAGGSPVWAGGGPAAGGLDAEVVAAEVTAATGLAEGPAGVRAVVREIARGAGSTRAVGRATGLPLPLVAAVCGELRSRGVLTAERPATLTPAGRAAFGGGGSELSGRCPTCAGRGVLDSAAVSVTAALESAAAAIPPVRVELDQTHCTPGTKTRRVLAMHDAGALAGRRVLVLGDDDLISLAIAEFAREHGAGPAALTVVELDPALVAFLRERLADAPFPVEVVEHDLAEPLPVRLLSTMDTVQTDPPYTVAGASLFLERAASALHDGAGGEIFLSLGVRRPAETVALQLVLARLGLAVRSMLPGFNDYVGAGVLGGTSALWRLVGAGPVESEPAGTVYTGAGRNRRRYVCTHCATAQTVGEGRRWRTVGELKDAGCPRCGGHTFRPRTTREPTGAR